MKRLRKEKELKSKMSFLAMIFNSFNAHRLNFARTKQVSENPFL